MRCVRGTVARATRRSRATHFRPRPRGAAVYLCTDRATGEKLALKVIPKEYTDKEEFQNEIDALLRIQEMGSHPNICR